MFLCAASHLQVLVDWKCSVAMSQWTVDALLDEISHLKTLHEVRKDADVVIKMATCIASKITGASEITPSMVVKLCQAVDNAPLNDAVKATLHRALDEKVMTGDSGSCKLVSKPQSLLSIYNYLSKTEAAEIQKAPLPHMVQIIVKRLRMVGLRSCKESTKKYCCAYLIHLMCQRGEPSPTGPEVYKLAQYLVDAFAGSTQASLVPAHAQYPWTPAQMGDEFLKKAYGDDEPVAPSEQLTSIIAAQLRKTPVRNTHELLSGTSMGHKQAKQEDTNNVLQALNALLHKAKQIDQSSGLMAQLGKVTDLHVEKGFSNAIASLPLTGSSESLNESSSSNALCASNTQSNSQDCNAHHGDQHQKTQATCDDQEMANSGDSHQELNDLNAQEAKSLEQFELEAFQQLQSAKGAKGKVKQMKNQLPAKLHSRGLQPALACPRQPKARSMTMPKTWCCRRMRRRTSLHAGGAQGAGVTPMDVIHATSALFRAQG